MKFIEKLNNAMTANDSLVCVGLDSDMAKLPAAATKEEQPLLAFNRAIIEATADLVCAYKLNTAFYEASGARGIEELWATCQFLRQEYPDIPVILDAKRGDIGNTNNGYLAFAFDYLEADALTLHPYLGGESLTPFLERADKGCIILCRTSNPGGQELQDLEIAGQPLYQVVASRVISDWNRNDNCLLVVGATYPEELAVLRGMTPSMPFLVPGVGAQGGDLEAVIRAGLTADKQGLVINSSRAIIFASAEDDFAQAARRETASLRDSINELRKS